MVNHQYVCFLKIYFSCTPKNQRAHKNEGNSTMGNSSGYQALLSYILCLSFPFSSSLSFSIFISHLPLSLVIPLSFSLQPSTSPYSSLSLSVSFSLSSFYFSFFFCLYLTCYIFLLFSLSHFYPFSIQCKKKIFNTIFQYNFSIQYKKNQSSQQL